MCMSVCICECECVCVCICMLYEHVPAAVYMHVFVNIHGGQRSTQRVFLDDFLRYFLGQGLSLTLELIYWATLALATEF